jgi:hypothetical protein
MRGLGAASLQMASSVTTVTHDKNGTKVSSFDDCTLSGPARNCGYVPNHVGTCSPGSPVIIGAGAPPPSACTAPALGSSTGSTVLRVCAGIVGCDHAAAIAESDGSSCASVDRPAVAFTCPSKGFFAVMSGPQTAAPGSPIVATPEAPTAVGISYPATEQAVFPWQEGAFFGNLWGPGALNDAIHSKQNWVDALGTFHAAAPVAGAVFLDMFACSGTYWTQAAAYEKDRICAGGYATPTNCAARLVGACSTSMSAPSCPPINRCSGFHGAAGVGDYDDCIGDTSSWANPITVYLNDPYDLSPPGGNATTAGTPTAPAPPACH